jgi:hypothetical protein
MSTGPNRWRSTPDKQRPRRLSVASFVSLNLLRKSNDLLSQSDLTIKRFIPIIKRPGIIYAEIGTFRKFGWGLRIESTGAKGDQPPLRSDISFDDRTYEISGLEIESPHSLINFASKAFVFDRFWRSSIALRSPHSWLVRSGPFFCGLPPAAMCVRHIRDLLHSRWRPPCHYPCIHSGTVVSTVTVR